MKLRKLSGKCCKDLEDQGLVHMCRVFDAEGAGYIGKKVDYLATAQNSESVSLAGVSPWI